ncbi:MAG: tetratricopeptide repeat protein, partial [Elusimicrobiaceae bacterium]|nr:tetratricopeptide repeat protein [Elusimicrobiaceae bacterium]
MILIVMRASALKTLSAAFLLALPASCAPGFCARDTKLPPDPYTQTMWDRIMIQQSYRNMQKGMHYMQGGDYQKAAREFGRSVVENKNDAWPHVMLGSALYWTGQVDQAMTEYETALAIDPENSQAHQLMGIAHAWKGDAHAALKSFLAAAKYEPNRSDIQMDIGSIYESLGRHDLALDYFRRAVKLEPRHPLYRYQLGLLETRLGMEENATESFREALSLYPDYEDAMLELGALYERQGKTGDALGLFRRAVKIKPRDSVARFRYARLLAATGKHKDADETVKLAFSLTPNRKGEGLSLSLAYSGSKSDGTDSPARGGGSGGPDGGSSGGTQQSPHSGQAEQDKKTGPVDSLKRNLERVPLDQEISVQAEIIYLPDRKPELQVLKPSERGGKSALGDALKKNLSAAPEVMSVKRQYSLPASDAAQRREMIKSLLDDIGTTLKEIPSDANMRMALNIDAQKPSASAAGTGGSGGPDNSGPAPAGNAPGRIQNKNARVTYNPRQVGNDMGLWVMGSSWLELVDETLAEIKEELENSDSPQLWVTAG